MNLKFRIIVFLSICFISCDYFDPSGLFYTTPVDTRFNDSINSTALQPPAVDNSSDYSFAVVGDTHYYESNPRYLNKIAANRSYLGISFIIVLGDLTQAGTKDQYDYFYNDYSTCPIPVYVIPGNHDLYNNGYEHYKKLFGPTVYHFKIGDTLFVFLDTANGTLGDKQILWLETLLQANSHKTKLIFTHYSFFDREMQSPTSYGIPEEAYRIFDLFDRQNVDSVYSGHLHFTEQRTIRGVNYNIVRSLADDSSNNLVVTIRNNTVETKKIRVF